MQFTEAHSGNKNTCITWNTPQKYYKQQVFLTARTHTHGAKNVTGKRTASEEIKRY